MENLAMSMHRHGMECECDACYRDWCAEQDGPNKIGAFARALRELKASQADHRTLGAEEVAFREKANAEIAALRKMLDELVNHCDKEGGECSVCGMIVCPHKDPLHFHHDGCPSCSGDV